MVSRIAIMAVLIAGSFASPSAALAATGTRARVDDLVLHRYNEGLPFEDAHRLGPGSLPRLAEILADTALKPYWATTTGAIGAVGGKRAFRILQAFVWKRFSGPVDRSTYEALTGAVSVLGFTCGPNDSRVVQLLEAHADPNRWSDVRWYHPGTSASKMRAMLSKLSIYGLGFCGTREAHDALLRLKREPRNADRQQLIGRALGIHADVMKAGLAGYMRRERARYPR